MLVSIDVITHVKLNPLNLLIFSDYLTVILSQGERYELKELFFNLVFSEKSLLKLFSAALNFFF